MIKIDKEFQDLIPPLTESEFSGLKKSIEEEGCRDSLVTWNGILIDGHNRHKICGDKIPFKVEEKKFESRDEVKHWILLNQFNRRNLAVIDRVIVSLKLKPYFKKKMKEKQIEEGKTLGGNQTLMQKSAEGSMTTRDEIAKLARVSHDTVEKVELIEKNADKDEIQRIRENNQTINIVWKRYKKSEQREQVEEMEFPKGKFSVIYADPPWEYSKKVGASVVNEEYDTLSIEKLKELKDKKGNPVQGMFADNSMLFLWATWPLIKEAFELIEAWGFTYKTCGFNWIKLNKEQKPLSGIGHYTKSNSEVCLIAIKGKGLTIMSDSVNQVIMTERLPHSVKPVEARERIVELIGEKPPKVELFSRQEIKGWTAWGNEVNDGTK